MSATSKDLEKLQEERRELEGKLMKIDEQEKTLRESIKLLEEQIAVRELKEKIKAKETEVASLSLEKGELEEKLREPYKLSILEAVKRAKEEIGNKEDALVTYTEEWPHHGETKEELPKKEQNETTEKSEQKKKKLKFF